MQKRGDEHQHSSHDDEIELIDLDTEQPDAKKRPAQYLSFKPRFTPRQRQRQILITISLILGAFLLLLLTILPIRQLLTGTEEPAATSRLLSGPDLFYFQRLPPWGTFFLDGQAIKKPPVSTEELPLRLSRGKHHLEWRGEPFQAMSCQLHVPPDQGQASDTCPIQTIKQPNIAVDSASVLAFPKPFSLQSLAEQPREALIQEVQRLLNTQEGIAELRPGEHYREVTPEQPAGTVQIATETWQVRQRFVLDTQTQLPARCEGVQFDQSCTIAGRDCRLFCTIDWPSANGNAGDIYWHVANIFHPVWSYTALKTPGRVMKDVQGGMQFVALALSWKQGQWHATFHKQGESSFDDPNCITTIGTLAADPIYHKLSQDWLYLSGDNRAQGCLALAVPRGSSVYDLSPEKRLAVSSTMLLQRFGVLLATSVDAHALWPALPVATESERTSAFGIVQHAVMNQDAS